MGIYIRPTPPEIPIWQSTKSKIAILFRHKKVLSFNDLSGRGAAAGRGSREGGRKRAKKEGMNLIFKTSHKINTIHFQSGI